MIKAEDLRIGDLVRVSRGLVIRKGTVCTVSDIRPKITFWKKKGIAILIPNKDNHEPWEVWCDDIEGVLLTPEILEKNGFNMREDTVVYTKNRLGLKPLGDGKGYQVGLGSLRFLFVNVRIIKYVHELQHILWALGNDANLKI